MQLIHDDKAFEQAIGRGRQQKKQQEPLHLSIAIGGALQPEKINQVKADIHTLITSEIDAFGQDPMRSLPSFASSAQPESSPLVHITLPNLGIPMETSRLLEGYLEHKVKEALAKAHPAISSTCILGNGIPGTQVNLLEILAIVTSVPPTNGGWRLGWAATEDIFSIAISATRLSSTDQVVIGLANTCSSCWAKEIEIFSICPPNNRGTLHLDGCNATPIFTTLFQAGGSGAHTIIFRKPKFLGIWTDMYHPDISTFWEVFGGRTITFTWVDDTGAKIAPLTSGAITVRRSNGSLFMPNEGWTNNPYVGSRGTFFADVTGDGKADAIVSNAQ